MKGSGGVNLKQALALAKSKVQSKIDDTLSNEVFKAIKEEESVAIDSEVYGVYTPKRYRNRGLGGGMADPSNIVISGGSASNGKLTVVNITEPNPTGCEDNWRVTTDKNLPELIEFGQGYKSMGYDFPHNGLRYMEPRPFTKKTIENLKSNKAHVEAMKNGLKKRGLNIK